MNALQKKYQDEVIKKLQDEFKIKNIHAVPKLQKIAINIGISEPQHQDKALADVTKWLETITGQKPKQNAARLSIAGFKLREGSIIGLSVTLRGERMYQFLQKLIDITLPRVKDFQGVSRTSFDHAGNYSLGMPEQIVFPEIDYDKIDRVRGLQVNFITSGTSKDQSFKLLELLGMPFAKEDGVGIRK